MLNHINSSTGILDGSDPKTGPCIDQRCLKLPVMANLPQFRGRQGRNVGNNAAAYSPRLVVRERITGEMNVQKAGFKTRSIDQQIEVIK